MYRIQHHRPDGSTSVDTTVDADNLDAKLHNGCCRSGRAGGS
ncbi:hypothetical protein [Burkholderia catarinensis]|nr:hypothetical protein [Burkholderia catarinensis]